MNFEAYIVRCLRTQPWSVDWQRHAFYVAAGLVSASFELAGLVVSARNLEDAVSHRRLARRVERFEFYRALTYYRLDLRPDTNRPIAAPVLPSDAALGIAVNASRVAMMIGDWLAREGVLGDSASNTLRRLESYRRELYALGRIDEEQIWMMSLGGPTHRVR